MKRIKSRKFAKIFVGLIVVGMILLTIPLQSIFGDSGVGNNVDLNDYTPDEIGGSPAQCCDNPGGVVLKWDDSSLFNDEKFWEVDVSDPMGTYSISCEQGEEPEVIGVCVKTGGLYQLFTGTGGSNDHVDVSINDSYASVTEKATTGDGGDVSHICIYYSCVENGNGNGETDTGSIEICKTYIGAGDPPAFFNFTITGPGYNNSIQVVPDGECVKLDDLELGTYTVQETDTGYDVVITGGNNSPKSAISNK
jgi:hypothetical protein